LGSPFCKKFASLISLKANHLRNKPQRFRGIALKNGYKIGQAMRIQSAVWGHHFAKTWHHWKIWK